MRRADENDRELLFSWANDPLTRRMSFSPAPIEPGEHRAWFAARLCDPDSRLYLAERAGAPVGLVRFGRTAGGDWELGLTVAPGQRGRGLAAGLIRSGIDRLRAELGPVPVFARTRVENRAFRRAAARAGFVEQGPCTVAGQAAVRLVWAG